MRTIVLIITGMVLCAAGSIAEGQMAEKNVYVDVKGSDANPGTAQKPLATLEKARDLVRALNWKGPVNVWLMPGTWVVKNSIVFDARDSGRKDAPITYRSQVPGKARLIGAKRIPAAAFKPITDSAILKRLDPSARNHVRCLSVKGLSHVGPFSDVFMDNGGIFELFVGGMRLPISRWPNGNETTTMGKVLKNGSPEEGGIFQYKDKRVERWVNNENIWLRGQWRVGWQDPAIKVASIDTKARTITFATGVHLGIGNKYTKTKHGVRTGNQEEPWFALNLLEEIDCPGEWALDFKTETLYLWMPKDHAGEDVYISQTKSPLIKVENAKQLNFIGLTLEYSLGDGIVLDKVDSCLVAGMTVRYLGQRGIAADGYRVSLQGNDVHHVGYGAIYIAGGDKRKIIPSENEVINNHLHHYGATKSQYSAGVHVGFSITHPLDAVGIRIAHNSIHHAPRDAVLYTGNDNLYEYNEIYYCGYNTRDTGAFYSNGDWTMRGNVIRYNYIHDTVGGVNPDDGASGNYVFGNVFSGDSTGVWIASGPDNTIKNNIFIKKKGRVFGMDDRGAKRGYAKNRKFRDLVKGVQPDQEPWNSRHPEVAGMLENHPELPWRTTFVGNLIVVPEFQDHYLKLEGNRRENKKIIEIANNFITPKDPGFVDMKNKDFTLRVDSIVFDKILGFTKIPFAMMGLKVDEYRKRLPTDEEASRRPEDSPYEEKDGYFET